jgi:hypothetical protein
LFILLLFFIKIKYKIINNFIILLIIIIFISIYLTFKGSIFDRGIIPSFDYPLHYYNTWLFEKSNFRYFNDYKIFSSVLSLIFKYIFSIDLSFSFRIVVFLSFLLPVVAIFLLARRINLSPKTAFLSSLFWLASCHLFFIVGNFADYLSLGLWFLSIIFYINYIKNNNRKNLLLSALILNLTILTSPVVAGFALLFFTILIIIIYRNIKLILEELMKLFFLLLPAFIIQNYFFLTLINNISSKIVSPYHEYVETLSNMKEIIPDTLIILFFGFAAFIYVKKNNQKVIYAMLILSIILFTLLISTVLFESILNKMISLTLLYFLVRKPLLLIRFLMVIPSAYFITETINNKKIITMLIIIVTLSMFFSFNFSFINFWANPNDTVLFNKTYYDFKREYPINFKGGIFSYSPISGIMEMFDWLEKNLYNRKILLEDVNDLRFGGDILINIPIYTNESFVGRAVPLMPSKEISTFLDKEIKYYNLEDFEALLKLHNIKNIVMWSKKPINKTLVSNSIEECDKAMFFYENKSYNLNEIIDFNEKYNCTILAQKGMFNFYIDSINKNPDFVFARDYWGYNKEFVPGTEKIDNRTDFISLHPYGNISNIIPTIIFQDVNLTKGKEYYATFSSSIGKNECISFRSDGLLKVFLITPKKEKINLWENIVIYGEWNNVLINLTKYINEDGIYRFQLEGWGGGENPFCSEDIVVDYFFLMTNVKIYEESQLYHDFFFPNEGVFKYMKSFNDIDIYEYLRS